MATLLGYVAAAQSEIHFLNHIAEATSFITEGQQELYVSDSDEAPLQQA
jgi:hypothetical protein